MFQIIFHVTALNLLKAGFSMAIPVNSSPLGTSPGSPQGSIPVGTGGNSNTTGIHPFENNVRGVNTVLAVMSALLVSATYAVLIGPGTRLASTSKLPLAAIESNIGALLERSWPDKSSSPHPPDAKDSSNDAIRLLYVGKLDGETSRWARGVEQCEDSPKRRIHTPPMWLTTGSSLTKSMVQLAIWEWVSIWMVLAMVISTLLFNGFFTHYKRPDNYPRLIVMMIYFAGFCVHSWYVWKTFRSLFSLVAAGASWSLLNKAAFASVDATQLDAALKGGPSPVLKQVGKPAKSDTFPAIEGCYLKDVSVSQPEMNTGTVNTNEDMSAITTVNSWQTREVNSTIEAGKTALERVVTNVMTMLGITITTGFSGWTSVSSTVDSTSQLGSLALLASLTLGAGAMFSSAIDLSVMVSSFRNVLFLKEVMINGQALAYVQKRHSKRTSIGFTQGSVTMRPVRTRDLAKSNHLWSLILFGSAYALLPSGEDHLRQAAGAEYEFVIRLREKNVLFTTADTGRHQAVADGGTIESINVCYLARAQTGSISSTQRKANP